MRATNRLEISTTVSYQHDLYIIIIIIIIIIIFIIIIIVVVVVVVVVIVVVVVVVDAIEKTFYPSDRKSFGFLLFVFCLQPPFPSSFYTFQNLI